MYVAYTGYICSLIDPDEVCQTGFPLIATESFDILTVCFLCGSAGLKEVFFLSSVFAL